MAVPSAQAPAAGGSTGRRYEVADVFRAYGEAYRATHRPSAAQRVAMRAIEHCRTAALGGHLEACQACGKTRPVYNSCRNRHCPKCQSLAQARWREAQRALLLPIPYFHVVFTLPHELNSLIRSNQRLLYGLLFQSVIETLQSFARDCRHLGAELGITTVLHTWGQNLSEHVHLHCIVSGGGLRGDHRRWVPSKKPNFLFPVRALSKKFRGKYLARLANAYDKQQLLLVGQSGMLQNPLEWKRLVAVLKRSKWVVYAKPPFAGSEQVLNYLSRYTHRIALSNERIVDVHDDLVRFRYKDYAHGNAIKVMPVSAVEFIRRFLLHVVPKGFMRVRHFGLLANRHRKEKLARCRELLASPPPAQAPADESLRDCVRRLMGVDISVCPLCGGGPMWAIETLAPVTMDTS